MTILRFETMSRLQVVKTRMQIKRALFIIGGVMDVGGVKMFEMKMFCLEF